MKAIFSFKLEEHLGTIYVLPIMEVKGSFEQEELEEFIEQLSNDIREKTTEYIKKKEAKE